MTKMTLPTPIPLETDGPLPAKTRQTTLKNPFKQALLLAVECIPLAYCLKKCRSYAWLHTRRVITSTSRHQITSLGLQGQQLQVGSQSNSKHKTGWEKGIHSTSLCMRERAPLTALTESLGCNQTMSKDDTAYLRTSITYYFGYINVMF